jgi:pyruvate dehydrogenase E1 component alpha subunit
MSEASRSHQGMTAFIDAQGRAGAALPDFARDPSTLIPLYQAMVFVRAFDEKAVALQRTGRLGTYASSLGQEAVGVGVASAMSAEDVLVPSFREQGAMLWRGVSPVELLQYWGGDERGSRFAGPVRDLPVSIPVASHLPHATGVALAMKLKGETRAAVAIAGDGATSKGDFYEALNIAGVWQLPVVFVICNNQWSISVPRRRQTAAATLADKAVAAGIPGEVVDGNDVVAVRDTVARALKRARGNHTPTLIEAETYRLADHTTADDAHRYRSDAEVSRHWKLEPISRLRRYLVAEGMWSKEQEEALLADCAARIEAATASYLNLPPEPASAVFDFTFASLPADLARQKAAALGSSEGDT